MSRFVNQSIATMIQILNPNGSPATTATVTAVIYDEDREVYSTEEMNHLANGIYTVGWQPNASGDWLVECICGNPVTRQSFVYHIEAAPILYAWHPQIAHTTTGGIVSEAWRTIFNFNPEPKAALRILTVGTMIDNDAHAEKDVQLRASFGGNTWSTVSNNNCAGGSNEYYWALGRLFSGGWATYAFNAQSGIQVYFGHVDSWRTHSETWGEFVGTRSIPLEIIGSCLIEARILDAGSNPTLQSCVNFDVLSPVE
jgi:hypothetical protein